MKKRARKILIAAAVILVLCAAGVGVYRAYLRPEALRALVEEALEAKLHHKVVIKSFEVDLFNRPRVTLEKLDYTNPGGISLQADLLVARFTPRYLLLGRLEIKDVWLKNPLITVDLARLQAQGQLPELPPISTDDGRIRLVYKGLALYGDGIKGSISPSRISLKGNLQGGTAAVQAIKLSQTWRGGAIIHGLRLDSVDARMQGKLNVAVEFKRVKKDYEFTLISGAQALTLPWGAHTPKASLTLSAQGDDAMLDLRKVVFKSDLMNARGTVRFSGLKEGSEVMLAAALRSDEFDYDALIRALPTSDFPAWLRKLLTAEIRGGRSQFKVLNYQGALSEMTRWDTCLKNLTITQTINGQSYGLAGNARVRGVTGTMTVGRGTIALQGLSGMINGSRLKRVDIKFPDFIRRGFRVALRVELDIPALDFLPLWRACVSPPDIRALLDPIAHVGGGQVRGAVSIFYEDVADTAVLKGGITLKDVGLTWDGIPIRRLNATALAPDYGDPLDLQTTCIWDSTTVESLKALLHDPLGEQRFTYVLKARGLKPWDSFRLDQDAPFVLSGDGVWPGLKGNLELRSHEFTLFDHRLSAKNGFITAKGFLTARLAPVFTLNIPDLALNLTPDILRSSIDMQGDNTRIRLKGSLNLANLKASGKDKLVPVDGGVDILLDMAWGVQDYTNGSLAFRQAKFAYPDKPLVLAGLLSFKDDTVKTQNLRIRQNQTTADVNGTLTLSNVPRLEADIAIDRLAIGASSQGESTWLKKFTSASRVTLTNFTYYGIPLSRGTAMAEVGPEGLRLKDINFSGSGGSVKGATLLSPEGRFAYQLDLDVKNTPIAEFIKAAWPGPPWMDGVMDLQGRLWGDDKAANGDVVFKARQGRIQRYNLLSKIFSVLNPYKMIKTGTIDLLHAGFPYNHLSATFSIRDSVISFNDFYLDSNSLQISAVGRYLIRTHYLDTILGIEPLETFDKTINQIPIVGWLLTGEKGSLVVVSLRVRGLVDDPSVKYLPVNTLAKPVAESLLRVLKLPLDLITKPGEVILPGVLKDDQRKTP